MFFATIQVGHTHDLITSRLLEEEIVHGKAVFYFIAALLPSLVIKSDLLIKKEV